MPDSYPLVTATLTVAFWHMLSGMSAAQEHPRWEAPPLEQAVSVRDGAAVKP